MAFDDDMDDVKSNNSFNSYHSKILSDISNLNSNGQYRARNGRCEIMEGLDNVCFADVDCNSNQINGSTDTSIDQLCKNLDTVELRRFSGTCRYEVPDISEEELAFRKIMFSDNFDPDTLVDADNDGDTLLHVAIIFQQPEIAILCIICINSAHQLSKQNRLWQSPMHLAVLTGLVTVVRELVSSGADILSRDKDGNTPFGIACREGNLDIVEDILKLLGNMRISQSIKYRNRSTRLFSLPNYEGETCLHLAAGRGHVEIVRLLVRRGADVNVRDGKTGRSVLHRACLAGNIRLVRALLDVKACNINARAYDGLTPFDLARSRSQDEICSILAAKGARLSTEEDEDSD